MTRADEKLQWLFQRLGGVDQVLLRDGEHLLHLNHLDPKLWVALSCPSRGLEFDEKTLALIDVDGDERIRVPELLAAVDWCCKRLRDPELLLEGRQALPLADIKADSQEGARLMAAAQGVLEALGRPEAEALTVEEVSAVASAAAEKLFNGDGIIPVHEDIPEPLRLYIADALAVMGGLKDASGRPGINVEISRAFRQTLISWRSWLEALKKAEAFGESTAELWELFSRLKDKIDDYFLRSDLAAFAPAQAELLAAEEKLGAPGADGLLAWEALATLPLARAEAGRPLDLTEGINPVWRGSVERLLALTAQSRAQAERLSGAEWKLLKEKLAAYGELLAARPQRPPLALTEPPTAEPETLGLARVEALLAGELEADFELLAQRDAEIPTAAADLAELEKLLRFHRDLPTLLRNFVSFHDFYEKDSRAVFQVGKLYIDGRLSRLCLLASEVEKHSLLAASSNLCLLYCLCTRRNKPQESGPEGTLSIVAAMTAGDARRLAVGRNGVFVDNRGFDWDATVIKFVPNAISLREAVWAPYRRAAALLGEQIQKLAGAREEKLVSDAVDKISAAPAAAKEAAPFDIGRSVGIFAAIALALGALGTALAALARAFLALAWWQIPLLFLGLFILISGTSILLGWLKLRRRIAGPLLEASGWALNSPLPISLKLGRRLTERAQLPPRARLRRQDPLAEKSCWSTIIVTGLAAAALALAAWLGFQWFQSRQPVPAEAPAASAPAELSASDSAQTRDSAAPSGQAQ